MRTPASDSTSSRMEPLIHPKLASCNRRGSLGSLGTTSGPRGGVPALRFAVHRLLEEGASRDDNQKGDTGPSLSSRALFHPVPGQIQGQGHGPLQEATGLPPLPHQRRKFSFPAALHSNLLGLASGPSSNGEATWAARRRFSNVSDAVSRKLSHTIGWRASPVPARQLAEEARHLCTQYMRVRLKREGLFSRKCGLQRMRTSASLPGGYVVREVFPVLSAVGHELERMQPKLYTGVTRQAGGVACSAPGGTAGGDKEAGCVLAAVARELFKQDVSWAKVVALYCVAGGLAADCVRQGRPDFMHSVPDAMAETVEDELAPWIASNGGWQGLSCHFKPAVNEIPVLKYVSVIGALVLTVLVLAMALRLFGKQIFV